MSQERNHRYNIWRYILYFFLSVLILNGCQSKKKSTDKASSNTLPAEDENYYQEITRYSGIDFVHSIGDDHLSNIVESNAGGASFLDYDQDGYIDLYICSGTWLDSLSDGKSRINCLKTICIEIVRMVLLKMSPKKQRSGAHSMQWELQ